MLQPTLKSCKHHWRNSSNIGRFSLLFLHLTESSTQFEIDRCIKTKQNQTPNFSMVTEASSNIRDLLGNFMDFVDFLGGFDKI